MNDTAAELAAHTALANHQPNLSNNNFSNTKIKPSISNLTNRPNFHPIRFDQMKIKFDETLHILEDSTIASPNFLNYYYYRDPRKKDTCNSDNQ